MENAVFSQYSNKSLFPVKGNFCDTVFTDTTLKHYLNWISDAAKIMKQKIYNATNGGAFIPNTVLSSLSNINTSLPLIEKNIRHEIRQTGKIKFDAAKLKNKIIRDKETFVFFYEQIKSSIKELNKNDGILSEEEEMLTELKEKILAADLPLLEIYKNKYYVMIKQLQRLDLESENFTKSDLKLFFLNMEYAVDKIIGYLKKIIEYSEKY